MALATLAVAADLSARGIPITNTTGVAAMLAAASAAVREAAGCAITKLTSTVTMSTDQSRRIELPARPVHSVTTVVLDGVTLVSGTDYYLRGSSLWRDTPWHLRDEIPGVLTVTFVHGLDEIPADVVDLVCALAGAGLAAITAGYASTVGKEYESIDDYRVGYTTGADAVASLMEIPERTRASLRRRFGSQVMVVGSVR